MGMNEYNIYAGQSIVQQLHKTFKTFVKVIFKGKRGYYGG